MTQPVTTPPPPESTNGRRPFYIANHVTYEGLDELQRLILAHALGAHVAIDGPPGVGKTQSVLEAARIVGLNVFTKTCSSKTSESHIISHPALAVKDGVSVTAQMNGPLCRAMLEPGIFYGDEFNLLKEDVQKRMNSAFDERGQIDRTDGRNVEAKPGFWGIISYNPSEELVSRDLEDSVADRFLHLHYDRWSADFKALVASTRSRGVKDPGTEAERFGIRLQTRGISRKKEFFRGLAKDGRLHWLDFFSNRPVQTVPEYVYRVFDASSVFSTPDPDRTKQLEELAAQTYSEIELARVISRFTELLNSLARTGESTMLKRIGLSDLREKEDLEMISLHESSTRIESTALNHYNHLVGHGFNKYLAQSYAVRLVIDQVCYGQYRNRKLRNQTVYGLVNLIAKSMRLFADNTKYNTRMITENLLSGK